MKNLSKILMVTSIISSGFVNPSYGMELEDIENGTRYKYSGATTSDYDQYRRKAAADSHPPEVSLDADEELAEDSSVKVIPLSTRIKGYTLRCGTIGCTTLIGAAIGYSVMIGEFGPSTATGLIKFSAPAIIGSLAGYGVGWGFGNAIKAKVTGRCMK